MIQEYNDTKRDYQVEITINEDGTYNLPMNFPIGIADIEHYRDFSNFPDGKEGYRKALSNMPKMIFIGEQEDTKSGHYAYMDGKTAEGKDVKFLSGISEGQMMNALKKYIDSQSGLQCKNINRVYDTISASEISSILQTLGRNEVVQDGKNGLNDCMQDGTVRISTEQEATRMVKETVLNKEKELDEAEQQK